MILIKTSGSVLRLYGEDQALARLEQLQVPLYRRRVGPVHPSEARRFLRRRSN